MTHEEFQLFLEYECEQSLISEDSYSAKEYVRRWMCACRRLIEENKKFKRELSIMKKKINKKKQPTALQKYEDSFQLERLKEDNSYRLRWEDVHTDRIAIEAQRYAIIYGEDEESYREELRTNKDIKLGEIKLEIELATLSSNERIKIRALDIKEKELELKVMRFLHEVDLKKLKPIEEKTNKLKKTLKDSDMYHTYISGGTGGGKSEIIKTMVKHHLKSHDKCIIIIDPKNDLAEQVAKFKDNDAERLVYLNPTLDNAHNLIINPFDLPVHFIRTNKYQIMESIENSFNLMLEGDLTKQMKGFIQPCIELMLYHPFGSFETLHDVLMNGEEDTDIKDRDYIKLYEKVYSEYLGNDIYKTTKEAIMRRLGSLVYKDDFRLATTGKGTVNLSELIEQNKLVIFNLKGMADNKVFGAFLISQIQSIAMSRHVDDIKNKTYLIIDECHNFITPTIDKILDEARSSKLFLVLAHQHLSQITRKNTKDAIASSASLKIAARQTAKLDSEEMARIMDIDTNQLSSLKKEKGECFIKVEANEAILVRNKSKLIDNSFACTNEQWEKTKKHQLARYYKKLNTDGSGGHLSERQEKILDALRESSTSLVVKEIYSMVEGSDTIINKDLQKLVEKKKVVRDKSGKSFTYGLPDSD